jgi:hypothetical protein
MKRTETSPSAHGLNPVLGRNNNAPSFRILREERGDHKC